ACSALFPYTTLFRSLADEGLRPMALGDVGVDGDDSAVREGSALDGQRDAVGTRPLEAVADKRLRGPHALVHERIDSAWPIFAPRSEEHTSELQSLTN